MIRTDTPSITGPEIVEIWTFQPMTLFFAPFSLKSTVQGKPTPKVSTLTPSKKMMMFQGFR